MKSKLNPTYRHPYRIPAEKAEAVMRAAMAVSTKVWTDELDCSKDWSRVRSEKTPDEVIAIGLKAKNTLWSFIHREAMCGDEAYFDIGLSTIGLKPEYFLWIHVPVSKGVKIIEDFSLSSRE